MSNPNLTTAAKSRVSRRSFAVKAVLALSLFSVAGLALATGGGTFTDTGTRVCGFFTNINSILDMVSVAVVTLAVIIAGYQIAFAHKRIADVAPILIGGVLIGVASQVAGMLIGDTKTKQQCSTTMVIETVHNPYA